MTRLAICMDNVGWWQRYEECARAGGLDYGIVDMERADWLECLRSYSHVLWRPNLDPPFCEEAKEKLYFLERFARKSIVPNWATFWHYDNKRAQHYFFQVHDIPTPDTYAVFSARAAETVLEHLAFPVVSKTSGGASASGVKLLRSLGEAKAELRSAFRVSPLAKLVARVGVDLRWSSRTRQRYLLWQEFIPDNARDLRVTVIGKEHVFAFWRNNRRNDFRASGSGSIDYEAAGVEAECRYCVELCRMHAFDVMAFDIIYRPSGEFVIVEMSYTFNDRAIHDAPRHYRMSSEGDLLEVLGHVWPQALLIEYVRTMMATDTARPLGDTSMSMTPHGSATATSSGRH